MTEEQTRENVAVIGAGTMGHGIAQISAMAGYDVSLYDAADGVLARAHKRIVANLDKGKARGKVTDAEADAALARITLSDDLEQAVASADWVIETVSEDLELKRSIFAGVEAVVPDTAILASNTSSLSLAKITAELKHPERSIGAHFFNPAHIMKLLEVVVHAGTSDQTVERTVALGKRLGKDPIVVKDSPGFASSRLGVVVGLEAMRMVEQGVASAEDIDKAMVLGYKHPMGPLRLTDLVGLDVRLAIAEYLHREFGAEQYRPPEILRQKVAAGHLGKKAGRGFYPWED